MNYLHAFATFTFLTLAACSSAGSGVACTDHLAAIPDVGPPTATGCYLRSRERVCSQDTSGFDTCTDVCASDAQSVVCLTLDDGTLIPTPNAALGCTAVTHPTPPTSQTYCCACSG